MASDAVLPSKDPSRDPLSTLLTSTLTPLSVRPSIGQRSASSRSLPSSTHPRVTIVIPHKRIPEELVKGIRELALGSARGNVTVLEGDFVPTGGRGAFVWVVGFRKDEELKRGLKISCNHDDFTTASGDFEIEITYNRMIEAFRGLGHVLGISRGLSTFKHPEAEDMDESGEESAAPVSETTADIPGVENGIRWSGNVGQDLRRDESCLFETVAVMIDCSRNGVMRVSAVKYLCRQLALMGNNVIQLYCEDTYAIKDEPFFGYFRGPYTEEELREIDDYAFDLGIEVVACIQTLGHLGQMLQWPAYNVLKDTGEVLLAESVETYNFIEKMILAISTPLRSKRIHIGMDEAHGVSEGRYRQYFGYKDSTKVFTDHLQRVKDICTRAGLAPMIWSDMLFCLQAKNNSLSSYYDSANVVSPQLAESMPDVDTVFWDYYHCDPKPYTDKIAAHWALTNRAPWMASGVWTFWTALPFTFATIRASMKASKAPDAGVTAVMTTIWGDEGNECDIYSGIPGMLYHAEHAYTSADEVDAALLRKKFDGIVGGDFDDYVYASKLDDTQPEAQPVDVKTHYTPNLSKFLLWEEPFYSFLSPQYQGYDLEAHYAHVATYLSQALSTDFSVMSTTAVPHSIADFPANKRLVLPCLLAKVLALKCHLRERLASAYKANDRRGTGFPCKF
ncbi:hypothetical protein RQP46_008572 [Phenoliferia psychrophenolica]